ncbi:DNA-directed RNA polymerase III subunit RPC7-like [Antedon mediterranea]|uniref:DNA-directed RNA polymerase III subunit RPC7-like n=1 Tax=Antedon mediterranea TaxID=105859 RepID=UPI003AF53A4E
MGGRGRGRGRGSALSFTAEVLGLGRGADALPTGALQPPPLFPPLEYKALPLLTGEAREYMLALKQEFRASSRDSPFYIKPRNKKKDIDRYSDKYQGSGQNADNSEWTPDWTRFPKELQIRVKKSRVKGSIIKPSLKKKSEDKQKTKEIENKLEELVKKEEEGSGKEEGEEEEEKEAIEDDEEFYDEEEMEEGTDYIVNYFDNGEDFAPDEDDNLEDGPVY